jgi:hypothetical protein
MTHLLSLHHFLKSVQFTNPAGDQVILDDKRKLEVEYDILNVWNFPEGLGLEVKVGNFLHMPHMVNNFLYQKI